MSERALIDFKENEVFSSNQERIFTFPQTNHKVLSLHVVAKGIGDKVNVDILIEVRKTFVGLDKKIGGKATTGGEAFTFTNEDIHGRLRVKLKAGAIPPSGNVDIELWGWSP